MESAADEQDAIPAEAEVAEDEEMPEEGEDGATPQKRKTPPGDVVRTTLIIPAAI